MNNVAVSFLVMFILILSGYLIGKFFDLGMEYYMPFLLWFLGLCIVNIYMKDPKDPKDPKS